jgi:hypothetical protein
MAFDLTMSLPREPRYAATARLIAAEAAREAGSKGAPAEAFAMRVEDAARSSLTAPAGAGHVVIAVRRHTTALEITIDHHTMRLDL